VIASDATERGSFAHTIGSNLTQLAFDHLDGPPAVVGSRNWITPAAELEDMFFPTAAWILDTIHERILPLAGHVVSTRHGTKEILERNRLGV
jgi:2-oxoisovalerate dehydrogenase E1 component